MTEPASSRPATPVVVAINAAKRCAKTLELATALASNAGADLEVVFVEDADLLRLADLPVTCEIDRTSGMSRDLDARRMLRALRCEVQQVRRELARLGKSSSVHTTMTVVRGHYLTEALAASVRGGVTFVHGARRPWPGDFQPMTAIPSIAVASGSARGIRPGTRSPLLTLFDGTPASTRALEVALVLSRGAPGRLTVLIAGGGDETDQYKREAASVAGTANLQFVEAAGNWLSQLGRVLAPGADSLLVLARKTPALEGNDARSYLEALSIPVVLVN